MGSPLFNKSLEFATHMQKILIIGGNGSGKTTFAKKLSSKTRLPLVHLDKLYWKDNWQHATQEEFDSLLLAELEKNSWIVDGNMKRTLPLRLKYCDTVIIFDFSRALCLWGAIKRCISNYGKSRDDMGGHCPEKISLDFYKRIWKENKSMIQNFYHVVSQREDINVIIFKNRKQAKKFLLTL